MRHPLSVALVSGLLALASLANPLPGQAATTTPFSRRLEQALNTPASGDLNRLLAGEQAAEIMSRYRSFSARFPDARWRVTAAKPLRDGRPTLEIAVTGNRELGGLRYALEASQRLALQRQGAQVTGEQIISEQSVLRTVSKPLPISLLIPDAVLTGSRYDVDVVVDQPLGDAIVAGGLIALTPATLQSQEMPPIQLSPLGGGGLFKSVQAPFQPGVQNWAALLVHPDGVIAVTKRVRVVEDQADLNL